MPEQHGIGREADRLRDDLRDWHRAELAVDEVHGVSVVEQRTADRQQAKRRQVVVRDAAADRAVRHVDKDNDHALDLRFVPH